MFLYPVCHEPPFYFRILHLLYIVFQRIKSPLLIALVASPSTAWLGLTWPHVSQSCLHYFFFPNQVVWNIKATLLSSILARICACTYLSCCSASSWAWSQGLGTIVWPHIPSSHRPCAVLNQSPGSNVGSQWFSQQPLFNQTTRDSFLKSVPPLAHSLHSQPGYWASGPRVSRKTGSNQAKGRHSVARFLVVYKLKIKV